MPTIYTFHKAYDHSIVASLSLNDDMADAAKQIAGITEPGKTVRYYVSNGVGVVAAFLCRNGEAHQILRDDYMQFSGKAAEARKVAGIN